MLLFFILSAFLASVAAEIPDTTSSVCPVVQIEAVRLPDLNVPRADHSLFCVNGEPTVVGGHTSGFVPTATAEYYRNGEWHLISTIYPHDNGFCLPLRSGEVLIGGGTGCYELAPDILTNDCNLENSVCWKVQNPQGKYTLKLTTFHQMGVMFYNNSTSSNDVKK